MLCDYFSSVFNTKIEIQKPKLNEKDVPQSNPVEISVEDIKKGWKI